MCKNTSRPASFHHHSECIEPQLTTAVACVVCPRRSPSRLPRSCLARSAAACLSPPPSLARASLAPRSCLAPSLEVRFRKRYLDLILNPRSRTVFEVRAKVINYIRRFLDMRNFLEVVSR